MSLSKIFTDYVAAATRSSLFATANVLIGYDNPFNINRAANRYPGIAIVPPTVRVKPPLGEYRTRVTVVIADYQATTPTAETERAVWERLETRAATFIDNWRVVGIYTSPIVGAEMTPLVRGVCADDVYGVRLTFEVKVQCL